MLKRIFKQKRYFKNIYKSQKGITGLETAIILIAFVVVAAVFAYTVLSAGLFSTQKSQEAVYNGLAETQATMVVKGAVLSQCDAKFADTTDNVAATMNNGAKGTVTQENTIITEGTGSMKIVTATDATTGNVLAVSKAVTNPILKLGDVVTFWAKTSGATGAAIPVKFVLDPAATLDSANTDTVAINAQHSQWQQYSVTVAHPGTGGQLYYGFIATNDCFGKTIYIDNIQVTPYADRVMLTLALSTGGSPIDFSAGVDNGNGLFVNSTNKIVINYNDAYTHLADVAWTGTFIGNNNNDAMLDPGEKIKLTISLAGVTSNKVDANHQFTLEIKSPKGAILSLQRTMPARLYTIDNLN